MQFVKTTGTVAAIAAGTKMATSYNKEMFFGDNALQLVCWATGLYPKLIAASPAEVRKIDQDNGDLMAKNFSIDATAQKAHYAVEEIQVPVEGGEIEVKIFKPEQAAPGTSLPLIIWYHGGGMCISDHNDPFIGADLPGAFGILEHFQCRAVVASVNYRLAPQHTFPTGANDAIAAMKFLHANSGRWGCDSSRMSVAGYSAGAYLAAVVSQAARNEGIPLRAAVLIAPMTRRGGTTQIFVENGSMPALTSAGMLWFWMTYCPDPAAVEDPKCEPTRGIGAGGLAPTLVLTNEFDVLRDEGVEYFEALKQAGVQTQHVRARASHLGTGFDKERFLLVLRWWSEALGFAESRL